MKHTHLLILLLCSALLPTGFVYGQGAKSLARFVTKLPARGATPAEAELAAKQAMQNLTLSNSILRFAIHDNPMKEQLRRATLYHQERRQAVVATMRLNYAQEDNLSLKDFNAQTGNWADFVVNHSFNHYLNKAVEANNYELALKELADYYSLGESFFSHTILIPEDLFAGSAVSYMTRHPHKMNLQLREVLSSAYGHTAMPMVQNYLKKNVLTTQDQHMLYNYLVKLYRQYAKGVTSDMEGYGTQLPMQAYEEMTAAIQSFIEQTGHFPRFNAGPEEQRLAVAADFLLQNAQVNSFKPLTKTVENLVRLKTLYPHPIWPKNLFVKEYTEFLKAHPDEFLPRAWQAENYTERDAILYDSYQYYMRLDPAGTHEWLEDIAKGVRQP